jgi:hypothetical protein
MMKALEFRTLGIIVTYKCNIECTDCCFSSSPRRTERLTLEQIKQLIDEAAELGSKSIVFTGGEPTLLGYELDEAIRYAHARRNRTRIVTNGWWGRTPEIARKHIARWQNAGLSLINLSVDDFHQAFVPLDYVKNAVDAAQELGMKMILGCAELKDSTLTAEAISSSIPNVVTYGTPRRGNGQFVSLLRGPALPFGAGTNSVTEDQIKTYEGMDDSIKGGCPMVLESPSVHPDGRVTACCGFFTSELPDLDIGRWPDQSLKEILDCGEDNLLLNWIRFEGLVAVRDFIKSKNPAIRFREKYANMCHLCGDILRRAETRQVLQSHLGEMRDHVVMVKLKTIAQRMCPPQDAN